MVNKWHKVAVAVLVALSAVSLQLHEITKDSPVASLLVSFGLAMAAYLAPSPFRSQPEVKVISDERLEPV